MRERMKILLQHKKTGFYFKQPGNWVREIEAASDFRTSQTAIDQINAECLADVQVVAIFRRDNYVESVCYQFAPRKTRIRL